MIRVIRQFPIARYTSSLTAALVLVSTQWVAAQGDTTIDQYLPNEMLVDASQDAPSHLPPLAARPVAFHASVVDTNSRLASPSARGCEQGSGGCGVTGTNLFWCNPYPEMIVDPCGEDACASCSGSTAPILFATVEFVPLNRDQKNDPVFQTRGRGGPAVLETGDFETEYDAGMRITLGAALTDEYRVEGAFLGGYEWSDRAAVRSSFPNAQGGIGALFSPFSNFGVPIGLPATDYNSFASIEMTSSFNSAEINVRRRVGNRPKVWPYRSDQVCVANSFLVGLRYIDVDESFGYATQSGVPLGNFNTALVDTSNEMFGVQIGMLSQFSTYWNGWIDFELKGGIYHNDTTLRSAYEGGQVAGGVVTNSFVGTDSQDRTTFLGELSLTYNHQVTSNVSLRLGYNAFWLSGIALASENLDSDFSILTLGPAQVDHAGDAVYHGPNIGFIFAY